jgi:hypothetical protein
LVWQRTSILRQIRHWRTLNSNVSYIREAEHSALCVALGSLYAAHKGRFKAVLGWSDYVLNLEGRYARSVVQIHRRRMSRLHAVVDDRCKVIPILIEGHTHTCLVTRWDDHHSRLPLQIRDNNLKEI